LIYPQHIIDIPLGVIISSNKTVRRSDAILQGFENVQTLEKLHRKYDKKVVKNFSIN
jgi:hypothetical protein